MRTSASHRWLLGILAVAAVCLFSAAHATPQPAKIGRIDRFWASWEGFDPEAYVMMKSMGERFSKLQSAASIARSGGDEGALLSSAREQLTDQVVDWATDINPAVKPIKAVGEFAIDGTQRWLDWSFRFEVNQMYKKYKTEFARTGNAKQAADAVSRWLDDAAEVATTAMKEKELTVLRRNRGLMLATIIDTHKRHKPALYEGKDVGRQLRGGKPPPRGRTKHDDRDAEDRDPGEPDPSGSPEDPPSNDDASKPTPGGDDNDPPPDEDPSEATSGSTGSSASSPASKPSTKPVTAALRQAVLDCMCRCNSSASSSVGVRYDPRPSSASPSCSKPSNGACINQGFGCWRHAPPSGGACADKCTDRHQVARGSVRP